MRPLLTFLPTSRRVIPHIFQPMASYSVRIEFWLRQATAKLICTHRFPACLIDDAVKSQNDGIYASLFMLTLRPITLAHGVACLRSSSHLCECCGSVATGIMHTPLSWLHKAGDPYIVLWVSAICMMESCALQTQQCIQRMVFHTVQSHAVR